MTRGGSYAEHQWLFSRGGFTLATCTARDVGRGRAMRRPAEALATGSVVSRLSFLDDGTWERKGDGCLSRSPVKAGVVTGSGAPDGRLEFDVRWEDGSIRPVSQTWNHRMMAYSVKEVDNDLTLS